MDSFESTRSSVRFSGRAWCCCRSTSRPAPSFHTIRPQKPGYDIAVPEQAASGAPSPAPAAEEPVAQRLASADVTRGENSAKKCAACHTFGKGEPNRVGPNLYGIIGRPKASEAGFNYSAAMKGQKGNWTFEDLDHYLLNPRTSVPGTNMTFAGIPRGSERADLLVYLNSKSDRPEPLPKVAEPAPAAPAARQAESPQPSAPPPAAATPEVSSRCSAGRSAGGRRCTAGGARPPAPGRHGLQSDHNAARRFPAATAELMFDAALWPTASEKAT